MTTGNSHHEDVPECPLCMEAFDIDELNFLPCSCGYQICRFCWHRIRTNETGLCPACRKSYPEDPAQFKPLSEDKLQDIRKNRKQREINRRQKSSENRKHLTNIRVVQKNLVFVVGLSQRLADAEILKKQEYFGKFGRIHKVVVNQSTSYVGSQGPSASAYVTYTRPEDAYHAILAVNNLHIDHRNLKASLGTTKYCSQFLKGAICSKADCMYLHDLGDPAASFSKEDIQQGKHLQYEQKLIKQYSNNVSSDPKSNNERSSSKSPVLEEATDKDTDLLEGNKSNSSSECSDNINSNIYSHPESDIVVSESSGSVEGLKEFQNIVENEVSSLPEDVIENTNNQTLNEDLGFDPIDISSKGLADLIEKEKINSLHLNDLPSNDLSSSIHSDSTFSRSLSHSQTNSENEFFRTSHGTVYNHLQPDHYNMDPRNASSTFISASSPTFSFIPSQQNRWQPIYNFPFLQHNNENFLANNTFDSVRSQNINLDPAIIAASIYSGSNNSFSQPFMNIDFSNRHLAQHQLHTPFSTDHRHTRLPPPGFPTAPSAEQPQLSAL